MKKYFSIIVWALSVMLLATTASAQVSNRDSIPVPVRKKRPKPIKQELSGGVRLNTDGWSIFMDRGKVKSTDRTTDYYYDLHFWQFEFGEHKHPQEIKRTNTVGSSAESSQPFIFGKTNNFFALKIGYGKRHMISGKPSLNEEVEPKHVSIHWVYTGGIAIGLEKPYYIDAYVVDNGGLVLKSISYSDTTANEFLAHEYIAGSTGFTKGIGETKIVPGIHGKTGLHFDFASSKKTKLAIETGIAFEMYSRAIELMATDNSKPYFVNAYVSFQFGKRWAQKK